MAAAPTSAAAAPTSAAAAPNNPHPAAAPVASGGLPRGPGSGISHPKLYRAATILTNRGLPGFFALFIVCYFTVGVSIYYGLRVDGIIGRGGGEE